MHVPADGPISSSSPELSQDLGRQADDGETLHKHAQREKISIWGQQKERRLDVGGVNNRYAWSRKGQGGLQAPLSWTSSSNTESLAKARASQSTTKGLVQASERAQGQGEGGMKGGGNNSSRKIRNKAKAIINTKLCLTGTEKQGEKKRVSRLISLC